MIGIIAGSGLYDLVSMPLKDSIELETDFGMPSAPLQKYSFENTEVVFLLRHGTGHSIAPHKVNYRANIRALKDIGVTDIISISAVGGINKDIVPGKIVIADQILDFTRSRQNTFFEDGEVVHIDFSEPYCPRLREIFHLAARNAGLNIEQRGTYVAVEGPRLETAAEISMFRSQGADVVGMTAMPEAALAREAEMCYTGLYIVTNHAAGTTGASLSTKEVTRTMQASGEDVRALLSKAIVLLDDEGSCNCRSALKQARM